MSVDVPRRTSAEEPDEHFIDEVEHPAARSGQHGTLSAPRMVGLVLVALLTASLFNSAGLLRAGESMQPGVTRSLTLAVARPVDSFAHTVGLSRPREALESALGHEDMSGGEIVDNSLPVIVVPPEPTVAPGATPGPQVTPDPVDPDITLRKPTKAQPLKVLVTGDSLATYVGIQMTNLTHEAGLVNISMLDRDGTGITNPSFFNWQKAARADMAKKDPEVVVMIIGGNDGWPMDTPSGERAAVSSDAWVAEYARRTAAVMRTFQGGGSAVYWSGPPTARAPLWDGIYRKINRAVAAAADAIPGVTYIDLYTGTAVNGHYAVYVPDGGEKVKARQPDGVHWTLDGSRLPARLILQQMETDADTGLR